MNRDSAHVMFGRFSRWVQFGCSVLFLFMGGLLLLGVVFSVPEIVRAVRAGDVAALRNVISALGGCGACWLQWRYRHWLYPRLRHEA
jgi:hypothetical protein